jgi:hypothetical protein
MVQVPESMLAKLMKQLDDGHKAQAEAVEAIRAVREEATSKLGDLADEVARLNHELNAQRPNVGPDVGELDENKMYVRIKPYNKALGHLRRRQYINELKQVAIGGTGAPGDIPQWYEVDEGQAEGVKRYRQDEGNPMSPQVFDVVSAAQRAEIDSAEEMWRRSQIGISGRPDIIARQTEAQTRAQTKAQTVHTMPRPQEAPPQESPSIVEGAQAFKQEPSQAPRRIHNAGREAALADLPDARFPDPGQALPEGMAEAVEIAEANPMSQGPVE